MSKIFRFLLLPAVLLSALFTAQAQQNVEWKSEVESLGDGNYRIVLTAAIPERFHMYDMGPYDEMGPNATVITFAPESGARLTGEVEQLIPLWVGMGVDELSVSIPSIPRVRRRIKGCDTAACRELVERVLQCSSDTEVRKEVERWL